MVHIIAGVLLVLSRLTAAVLAFGGLITFFISLLQDDYFVFEQAISMFVLAALLALVARLLRRFEL